MSIGENGVQLKRETRWVWEAYGYDQEGQRVTGTGKTPKKAFRSAGLEEFDLGESIEGLQNLGIDEFRVHRYADTRTVRVFYSPSGCAMGQLADAFTVKDALDLAIKQETSRKRQQAIHLVRNKLNSALIDLRDGQLPNDDLATSLRGIIDDLD